MRSGTAQRVVPRPGQFALRSAWLTSSSLLLVTERGLSPCIFRMCPCRRTGGLAEDSPGFEIQNCCSRSSAPAVASADRLPRRRSRRTDTAAARVRRRTRHRRRGTDTAAARAGTFCQAGAQVALQNTLSVFLHVPASGDANERARIEAAGLVPSCLKPTGATPRQRPPKTSGMSPALATNLTSNAKERHGEDQAIYVDSRKRVAGLDSDLEVDLGRVPAPAERCQAGRL